jgi:hypothetical protein
MKQSQSSNTIISNSHPLGSASLGMLEATEAYVVHHTSISGRVLQDHFNFKGGMIENFMTVDSSKKQFKICSQLVENFSHPGEWVLDFNSEEGVYCCSNRICFVQFKYELQYKN